MRTTRLIPALLLACLLGQAERGPSAPHLPLASRGCKPEGPLVVRLSSQPAAGARTAVEVELQPVLELDALAWRWELSPGVVLVRGAAQGEADAGRGAVTRLAAELQAPQGFGRARLVARAAFTGHDADGQALDERFEVLRTLEWGEPPVDAPRVLTADAAGGAPVEVIAVPALHRPGS